MFKANQPIFWRTVRYSGRLKPDRPVQERTGQYSDLTLSIQRLATDFSVANRYNGRLEDLGYVEGQGRDDAHRKVRGDDGPPVIELDYSFMRTSEPEDTLATVLLGYTKRSSYGFAMKVDKKGPTDRYAITNSLKWLGGHGLATGVIRLRSDSETSIRAVAAAIAAFRTPGETMLEVSSVHSSSSLGAVERWPQSPAGLVRTMVIDAGRRLGQKFKAKDALFAWAVRATRPSRGVRRRSGRFSTGAIGRACFRLEVLC